MNYNINIEKGFQYTVDSNGEYHSYAGMPSIRYLDKPLLIYHNHGKIHNSFGPAIITDKFIQYYNDNIMVYMCNNNNITEEYNTNSYKLYYNNKVIDGTISGCVMNMKKNGLWKISTIENNKIKNNEIYFKDDNIFTGIINENDAEKHYVNGKLIYSASNSAKHTYDINGQPIFSINYNNNKVRHIFFWDNKNNNHYEINVKENFITGIEFYDKRIRYDKCHTGFVNFSYRLDNNKMYFEGKYARSLLDIHLYKKLREHRDGNFEEYELNDIMKRDIISVLNDIKNDMYFDIDNLQKIIDTYHATNK